jgi:hypothetical protein
MTPSSLIRARSRSIAVLAVSLWFAPSVAEARRFVPLMPATNRAALAKVKPARSPVSMSAASYRLPELGEGPDTPILLGDAAPPPARRSDQALGLGFEAGTLSTPTNTAFGFSPRLAPGGRAYLRIPLWERFYLKSSLGYFYQTEGTALLPVTRHVFEIGATLQYSLLHSGNFRLLAGLTARADLQRVEDTDIRGGVFSAFETALRGGPMLGMLYGIGPSTSLSLDAEATYSTLSRFQLGLTAGVVFYLR